METSNRTQGKWAVIEDPQSRSATVISLGDARKSEFIFIDSHSEPSFAREKSEFICKAVNSHDELVDALKELTEITRWVEDNTKNGCGHLSKLEKAESVIKKISI